MGSEVFKEQHITIEYKAYTAQHNRIIEYKAYTAQHNRIIEYKAYTAQHNRIIEYKSLKNLKIKLRSLQQTQYNVCYVLIKSLLRI